MVFGRLYSTFVCGLVALFVGLNTLAMSIGMLRPNQPALAGFTIGCAGHPQPCWYGIVPGVTKITDAQGMIPWKLRASESGMSESRYYLDLPNTPEICGILVDSMGEIVSWMKIEYCENTPIRVGDVIAVLGMPDRILGANREMSYGGVQTNGFGWWSLFDHANSVALLSASGDSKPIVWRGFMPKWRYCQLEAVKSPECS